MNFNSVNIQGNIISTDILDKIRNEDIKYQGAADFGLAQKASLRDEIGLAWSLIRTHWDAYKKRLGTLPKGDTGTSLTREKWIIPFLTELGYELAFSRKALVVNEKNYEISHQAVNRDSFPVLIMGYNDDLDKRRESGGPKVSPHALMQEYLNHTEHLFALVTNGRHLRLLRDATRLVRLSYLEFDLEKMMEEELYADFALLYRTLHSSRMPEKIDESENAIIEFYHQESLSSGSRIRNALSEAVEISIRTLANGFLHHPYNEQLREKFEQNRLKATDYYSHLLRLIYRMLFLIVIEERKLIYPPKLDEKGLRLRQIYFSYYSIERLRKLAEHNVYVDGDKHDLWEGLLATFRLFEDEHYGSKLGISPLGSGLFAPDALGDLQQLRLNNQELLKVLKSLTTFYDEQKQLVRVNYSDLDVEEFGSVYEGLLDYDPEVRKVAHTWSFNFVKGEGRSSSGSHYTPEELVKPLIKHSLDYIIEDKLKEEDPEKALLSISVCDVACGSGHILLSAARRIATELASLREGAEQPSPAYFRVAIRDVIKHCIYGVDLNPLAVELCKVALWLEAHNPGEPLNFLDHRIKCGNAIVGLAYLDELQNGIASEAFKTLPGDDKNVASNLRKLNDKERKTRLEQKQLSTVSQEVASESVHEIVNKLQVWNELPEHSPEEISEKAKQYHALTHSKGWWRLKQLADIQVAQFFISKQNASDFVTSGQYFQYLDGQQSIQSQATSLALGKATEKRFFHWFLEFPEVMRNGGFDCILGNPPYLGGAKISGHFTTNLLNFIRHNNVETQGQADLVTYFIRRDYAILKENGSFSLVTTNSITDGDTREGGLQFLLKNGGHLNFVLPLFKWPGVANLTVSLFSIMKGKCEYPRWIGNRRVDYINAFFTESNDLGAPYRLIANSNTGFKGSEVVGDGFYISDNEAHELLREEMNTGVVKRILSGNDITSDPAIKPSRWIIYFSDLDLDKSKLYSKCIEIVKERVKPLRDLNKDKRRREIWWQFSRPTVELYNKYRLTNKAFVNTLTAKYLVFTMVSEDIIFNSSCVVFPCDNWGLFGFLQSAIHEEWVRKYGSSLETRMRYTVSDVFETFPLANTTDAFSEASKYFYMKRSSIMKSESIGFTSLYNQFHDKSNFANHLNELRDLHKKLDLAALKSYKWEDIELHHGFYELDYLPENDRVRYTIHPDARKEVLKRLLLLNHERWEEEARQGLHDKKTVEKFYTEKGEPIREEVIAHFRKGKKPQITETIKKPTKKEIPESQFEFDFSPISDITMKEFGLNEGIYSIIDTANITGFSSDKIRRWFKELAEAKYEGVSAFDPNDIEQSRISFHGLIELVVIGTLREYFSLKKILTARKDLGGKTGKIFPFATNNVRDRLKVAGKTLQFILPNGDIINLDGTSQLNISFINEFFRAIVFDIEGVAQRLIPEKGMKQVIIDPKVGGGKPSLKNHEGVLVDTITRFYHGPESIPELMKDYGVSKEDIDGALSYMS